MNTDLYTPPELAELALRVLGGIDLDPATDNSGCSLIQNERGFTADDDGLSQPWHGRVWLFPPHDGRRAAWVQKLLHEHRRGRVSAALLYTALDSRAPWFHHLTRSASICFVSGSMQAVEDNGQLMARSRHGAILAYLGPQPEHFSAEIADLGTVMQVVE
ncbi:hypothetical protein U5801_11755 [Lamprobacter modestohalophilus]|uniref:hypothetical protein n=1 Tax=Lamprobacter modestohalophilus TaxID=1064514 RepID=UPI002ADEBB57|nr:hypothetical protein [Lamprobacter modestohalophilus]MEA1050479.1 hypothetical protein [Lamprobacter modestohalophilus]